MNEQPKELIVNGSEEGATLAIAGSNYRILLTGVQTEAKLAIIEMLVPPDSGPVPHEHKSFQESFYVLEGSVEVRTSTQTIQATKGSIVTIPVGGPVHSFKNNTNENAKLLCIVTPSGLDEFFMAAGKSVAFGVLPEKVPLSDDEKARIGKLAEQYGQKLYPPDFFG